MALNSYTFPQLDNTALCMSSLSPEHESNFTQLPGAHAPDPGAEQARIRLRLCKRQTQFWCCWRCAASPFLGLRSAQCCL
eukprot:2235925-Amphidinium_carterae.1